MPFVLNVQDLFPQSIIDLGLLRNRAVIWAFRTMERFIYRHASCTTVHSEGNRSHVTASGGEPHRVTVVPNWVDTEFIQPGGRMNEFRREYNLGDDFIVSFAGVLGYSQDLDVVLEAANLLRDQNDITWLIVGDGVEASRLKHRARVMGLEKARFIPMQPRERYPAVLHASDVGLATLHGDVHTPVVPSKILSIMAAGLPVVASLPLAGDAPRLVEEAACGICLPPGDPHALAEAVSSLYGDRRLCKKLGEHGRQYAETELSLEVCVDRYEALLDELVAET
jgi:glycosyltransferase involved in cell wall biosynthesis